MKTKTLFIAEDGKEFNSEKECLDYENTLKNNKTGLRDQINSWEDVCVQYGIDPVKSLPYPNPEENTNYPVFTYEDGSKSDPVADKKWANAGFKMQLITRLFNKKRLEYDSGTQGKCWAWFRKRPSGFGFDGVTATYDRTDTYVGPRLSFLNEDDLKYVANHPKLGEIYSDYYNQ